MRLEQAREELEKTSKKASRLFPPGLEPRTFRVLGERDNHYTTETEDSRSNVETCLKQYTKCSPKHRLTNLHLTNFPPAAVLVPLSTPPPPFGSLFLPIFLYAI